MSCEFHAVQLSLASFCLDLAAYKNGTESVQKLMARFAKDPFIFVKQ